MTQTDIALSLKFGHHLVTSRDLERQLLSVEIAIYCPAPGVRFSQRMNMQTENV